jgi:signal peptidase I
MPPEPARQPPVDKAARNRRVAIEWTILIIAALVIAFLIKTFLFQAFYIPSGSMEPTLKIGDRVLVNKLSYDLHDIHRGDIIVFKAPPEAQAGNIKDLVKRVIGLPGDVVELRQGVLYVNGRRVDESYLAPRFRDDESHAPIEVKKGYYYVLGDHRNSSNDSRSWGEVPQKYIYGRAEMRFWPLSKVGLIR